jgi:hypothetical protein
VTPVGTDVESYLQESRPSKFKIAVAKEDTTMHGSRDGVLPIFVLNTAQRQSAVQETPFHLKTTTVKDLRTELFSFDGPYQKGNWNILLRQPDFETGENELYRPARDGDPEARIPLRYDYEYGGWWIDYLAVETSTPQHQDLLSSYQADLSTECNSDSMAECQRAMYTKSAADGEKRGDMTV